MRVIASVQSKRGSSRGIIHYLAHSKIDSGREPEHGRELFNAFTEHLTVQSANNFLKSDCGKGRPSNNELHHLVLSFKQEDFQKLGSADDERKRRLKNLTRFAMGQFEKSLHSEKLAWAGAVHLNTANPHVHIAIQKQYLTKDLKGRTLTKIPREALPHFEMIAGEKQLVDGILIESAKVKLEELVARRMPSRKHGVEHQQDHNSSRKNDANRVLSNDGNINDRQILRRAILAEYQLRSKEEKITFLIEHRENLKFPVADPASGIKHKVSLKELESAANASEEYQNIAQRRQARAISNSILAKEESEFFKLKEDTALVRDQANQIRKRCKKSGARLPLPALNKLELDELQNQCLANSKTREYLFLEQIRIGLETKMEVGPRDPTDLEHLAGHKVLSEMRVQLHRKQISDFKDNSYYRKILIGKEQISLAMIDRESNGKNNSGGSVLQSIRFAIQSLTNREKARFCKANKFQLYDAVNRALNEESLRLHKDLQKGEMVVTVMQNVIDRSNNGQVIKPKFSDEQLIQLEAISGRLKVREEYTANWNLQKKLIIAAGGRLNAIGRKEASANGNVTQLIAGRALAREILCSIGITKAKEELAYYRKTKRFHKFAVKDEKQGSISYLSLNDVDPSRKQSVLDQALNLLLESKDHRKLRRELECRVKDREAGLRADLAAAKELAVGARSEAAGFKEQSFWGDDVSHNYQPIFTTSEIAEIEKRIEARSNCKEAVRLKLVLERSSTESPGSFSEFLSKVMAPETKVQSTRQYSFRSAERVSPSGDSHRTNQRELNEGIQR